MTYLDTHIVLWLHDREHTRLSSAALRRIDDGNLGISPAVVLELEFLYEIGRLTSSALKIVDRLSEEFDVTICKLSFASVVEHALPEKWIRDPFDRLIVAHARANAASLVTKDEHIRRHYRAAIW